MPKLIQSVLVSVVAVWAEATHWAATLAVHSAVSVVPPALSATQQAVRLAVGAMPLVLPRLLRPRSAEVSEEAWVVGHLVSNRHSLRPVGLVSVPLLPPPLAPLLLETHLEEVV